MKKISIMSCSVTLKFHISFGKSVTVAEKSTWDNQLNTRVRFVLAHSSSRVNPGLLSPFALGPWYKHVIRQTQGRETEHRKKGLGHKYTPPGAKIFPLVSIS